MSQVLSKDLMKHSADFSSQSSPEICVSFVPLAATWNKNNHLTDVKDLNGQVQAGG